MFRLSVFYCKVPYGDYIMAATSVLRKRAVSWGQVPKSYKPLEPRQGDATETNKA